MGARVESKWPAVAITRARSCQRVCGGRSGPLAPNWLFHAAQAVAIQGALQRVVPGNAGAVVDAVVDAGELKRQCGSSVVGLQPVTGLNPDVPSSARLEAHCSVAFAAEANKGG